jgi:hypothetical protein
VSFARKVARREHKRTSASFHTSSDDTFPRKVALPLKDVRTQISGADGRIQCPQCHSSETLVRMTCKEFGVTPALKKAHDELGRPGHEHVRCRNCNQFIIYTLEAAP